MNGPSIELNKDGKSIFNGKNLDGWKIHGTEKWYVQDGLLICESGPDKGYGYLSTEKFYNDFELEVEFIFGKFEKSLRHGDVETPQTRLRVGIRFPASQNAR